MGILSKILGTGDVVEKGLKLIDDVWETDAERRESKTKAKIDLMNAYAPFKVAQRYIALMFTGIFLLCFLTSLGFTLTGYGNPDEIAKVMGEFQIGWAMTTILLFYFGGGLVESVGRTRK